MPFKIIRNDITRVKADAIVNTANIHPVVGGGTDTAIYNAAGKEKLFAARELIGDIEPGQARETAAYNLNAKFIIHTVCVPWNGGNSNELNILADCYRNSLKLALELNCKSIAFPLIGTGVFGIPYDKALNIARSVSKEFLKETESNMKIILVVFDQESYESSTQISKKIQQYIDDNYVENAEVDEYGYTLEERREINMIQIRRKRALMELQYTRNMPLQHGATYEQLRDDSMSFVEKMFKYADEKGMKYAALYGGTAGGYFSKSILSDMNNNFEFKPGKNVCIIICLTLKLNMDETLDMLGRAGYTLSRCIKEDLYIKSCIQNKRYDVPAISRDMKSKGYNPLLRDLK